MTKEGLISYIKRMKLKKTPKRVALIELMYDERKFYSPKELWEILKPKFGHLGLPTIYRILQEFQELGIVMPFVKDNQVHYFLCDKPNEKHHHHFVCKNCRKVTCIDYCDLKKVSKLVTEKLGATIENHFIQIEGYCQDCKQ